MLNRKVDDIIKKVTQLKPMPSNVSRIIWEIEKSDITIDTLTGLISLDQALTALVLQMSNSVSLGYSHSCSTLKEAVMYIGLARLKSILMTSSAANMLKSKLAGYRLGVGELWLHSLATAVAAEWLAQALKYPNAEEAYISGLLHDIGKLLLDQYVLGNYIALVDSVKNNQQPLWLMEEKLLGINHASVGGLIAKHWNFPTTLVDAICYHHYPSFAKKNHQLSAIINLANVFVKGYQLENTFSIGNKIHPESMNILKIDIARVEELKIGMMASGRLPETMKSGQTL